MTGDSAAEGIPTAVRWRYTNGPTTFAEARQLLFFELRMDTWYWSEWEIDGRHAIIGIMDLGDRPLTLAQDVSAFLVEHVQAFREHFTGVLRPRTLCLWSKPDLTGARSLDQYFRVPQTAEDAQALQGAIDRMTSWRMGQGEVSVDAVHGMVILCDVFVTIRDERGAYEDLWLPWAGTMWYHANGYSGDYISPTHGVVGSVALTPLGLAGRALWNAELSCDFLSLYRPDNTAVLDRVRAYWQTWLETHSTWDLPEDGETTHEQLEEREEKPHEAYFMTLAEPPQGTPPDNQDLFERNWPRLQKAVQRWEQWIEHPFDWSI